MDAGGLIREPPSLVRDGGIVTTRSAGDYEGGPFFRVRIPCPRAA